MDRNRPKMNVKVELKWYLRVPFNIQFLGLIWTFFGLFQDPFLTFLDLSWSFFEPFWNFFGTFGPFLDLFSTILDPFWLFFKRRISPFFLRFCSILVNFSLIHQIFSLCKVWSERKHVRGVIIKLLCEPHLSLKKKSEKSLKCCLSHYCHKLSHFLYKKLSSIWHKIKITCPFFTGPKKTCIQSSQEMTEKCKKK